MGLQVHEYNIFFLLFVAASPVSYWIWRRTFPKEKEKPDEDRLRTESQKSLFWVFASLALQGALLLCAIVLEHYWALQCPVAPARFHDMTRIFQLNVAFLESHYPGRAYVAEGTMLAVARGNNQLNIWDQDSDMFLVIDAAKEDPESAAKTQTDREAASLVEKLNRFYDGKPGGPYTIVYEPDRWLVQVHGPDHGHGDIWLWQKQHYEGLPVIFNPDFTFEGLRTPTGGKRHPEEWVLPVTKMTWNGVTLPVANQYSKTLENQYGGSFMVPYRNRLQCVENLGTKVFPSALFFLYVGEIVMGALGVPVVLLKYTRKLPTWNSPVFRPRSILSGAAVLVFFLLLLQGFVKQQYVSSFEMLKGIQINAVDSTSTDIQINAVDSTPTDHLRTAKQAPTPRKAMPLDRDGPLSDKQVQLYKNVGFLVLKAKDWLTDKETGQMLQWAEEVQNWPEKAHHWMKYFETSSKDNSKILNRVENYIPYHEGLNNIFNGSKALDILEQLHGGPMVLYKDKINMKLPGGGGFEPHQDILAGWGSYNVSNFVTLSVSIDHAHEKNGALECVASRHKQGKLGGDWAPLGQDVVDSMQWDMVPTEPGDMILFDAYVPHRSAPNNDIVPRRNLYLTYNRADEGDHRLQYFKDKRANYPPDIERLPGVKYEYKV